MTPHHQDGSLPYSQAPAVSVRLLSNGTMKPLRLPTFSPGPSFGGSDRDTLGCPKDGIGSPKFPGNPSVPLLCSQTPAEPWCLAFTALRCCPHQDDKEGLSDQITFGALSQSFSTRCLRFVPPLRATTQNSLPGVANLSGWEFNTH